MHTVRARGCQTLYALGAAVLLLATVGRAFAGDAPPPAPPAWQQEIDAAYLLEGTLAFAPAKDADEQEARHRRLQDLYRQIAAKYPGEAPAQKAAGDFFARDGQPGAALPFWEAAARIDPRDGDTASQLGGAYLRLGRTRDAYGQFQRAADAQPNVAAHQSDLANVLYLFRRELVSPPLPGLPDEQTALNLALAHFRRAAELAPTDLQVAKAYAETFYIFAKPDWVQALGAWEAVRALSGEKSDFSNSHLARISLRLGRPDAATGFLALMHDPAFDALKAKLLLQADKQRAEAASH